ncbi:MAG: hypothetical protein WA417_15355 [Stellaceae bacterium]|jgi:hypothetical protein
MQPDPQSLPKSRSRLATVGLSWIAVSRSAGRRFPDRRSADFGKAIVGNKKSLRLTTLQIPPLLWPIY